MRIYYNQLQAHLEKELADFYLIYGDEPLLLEDARIKIIKAAEKKHCEKRILFLEENREWQNLISNYSTISLFANYTIFDARLFSKPSKEAVNFLSYLLDHPNPNNCFLLNCQELESQTTKTKWFKNFLDKGVVIYVNKLSSSQYPTWLADKFREFKFKVNKETILLICDLLEGNLLAMKQLLEQFRMRFPTFKLITNQEVIEQIEASSQGNVFQFADLVISGNIDNILKHFQRIKDEKTEAPILLWALTKNCTELANCQYHLKNDKNITQAMEAANIWQVKKNIFAQALTRKLPTNWQDCLSYAYHVDKIIKGVKNGDEWHNLLILILMMAGHEQQWVNY